MTNNETSKNTLNSEAHWGFLVGEYMMFQEANILIPCSEGQDALHFDRPRPHPVSLHLVVPDLYPLL